MHCRLERVKLYRCISVGLKELKLIVGLLLFFCGSFFDIFNMHFGDIRSLLCSKRFSHSNIVWVFSGGARGIKEILEDLFLE